MDFNNQTGNFPIGLPIAVAMNEQGKTGFNSLSEAEKEHLILKYKDAKTKEERDRIIDSVSSEESIAFNEGISPEGDIRDLFHGPGIG